MYEDIFNKLNEEVKNARVMAVSKTRSLQEIQEAYKTGFKLFGENHVNEIVEKFTTCKPSDIEVHMIGHLQTNKVSKVVSVVDMIESVDSLHLLEKINSCCEKINKIMPILLEVNTSKEEAKSGFDSEDEFFSVLDVAGNYKYVQIKGLMTVGPLDHSFAKESFTYLAELRNKCMIKYPNISFEILSMGMSQDYKIGLECGSNLVRIGTAIFGERFYG